MRDGIPKTHPDLKPEESQKKEFTVKSFFFEVGEFVKFHFSPLFLCEESSPPKD